VNTGTKQNNNGVWLADVVWFAPLTGLKGTTTHRVETFC